MNISKLATFFANRKLYKGIKLTEKVQYESVEKLASIQEEKFKKLIDHAKKNVPYYKDKLDAIYKVSDISNIPILTKDIIKEFNETIKATNLEKSRFMANSTSGSTGESTHFYSDKEYSYKKGANLRGDSWAGLNYGEKSLHFWGAERDIDKSKSFYKKIKHKYITKQLILSTYHMSENDLKEYINIYNEYKPKVIISYPTPLHHLAQYIEENKIKIWIPKGIITSAETLFPFQREKIEKVFKTKIFNRYGCREVGNIAAECEEHNGLHIYVDRFVVEVVNAKGEECKAGELGELLITDLDNYVFPLIRYKIGDLGVLSDRICDCGRNLPLLEKVEGRVFDLIVGVNGNTVAGTFWTLLRNKIKGFKKFQILQEETNKLKVIIENNKEIQEGFESHLTNLIKEKLGNGMQITIEKVNAIPLTKTGKHRWIISNISPYVQ